LTTVQAEQGWNEDGNKFWRDRWDGIEVLREWVGMEVKVDGTGGMEM